MNAPCPICQAPYGFHDYDRHPPVPREALRPHAWQRGFSRPIGRGLPRGLCVNREDHEPHVHDGGSLGRLLCTANQDDREPYRSERRRRTEA